MPPSTDQVYKAFAYLMAYSDVEAAVRCGHQVGTLQDPFIIYFGDDFSENTPAGAVAEYWGAFHTMLASKRRPYARAVSRLMAQLPDSQEIFGSYDLHIRNSDDPQNGMLENCAGFRNELAIGTYKAFYGT